MTKVLCVVLLFLCAACDISATRTVIAHGIKPHSYRLLEKSNASSIVNFKVLLKQSNTDLIDKTFWEVSDPKHPRYGKFLTRSELDSLVTSPPESIQAVEHWLNQEGVTSSQLTIFSDYISVKVPVSHAEQIFQSSFFDFQSKKGKKITRIDGTASIPEEIVPHIDFISGLSEFLADAHHTPVLFSPRTVKRTNNPTITPQVLSSLYNIVVSTPNSTNSQGIAAFADYYSSGALQNFGSHFDIPSTQITTLGQDCLSGGCDQAESDLDVQYMTAIGQGIPTYFINQDGWILDWAQQIEALENPPLVNSISYGIEEFVECDHNTECQTFGYNAQQYIARTDTELAKLGTLGITVMVSSGDSGAPGLSIGNCPIDDSKYCPLGGCKHKNTNCGALTFINTSTKETCFFPMGIDSDACSDIINQKSFNEVLNSFGSSQTDCDVEFDQDSSQNYHVYSSCTCDQIQEYTYENFEISGYTFDQNAGAIFSVSYPATSPYVTAVGATMLLSGNTEIAASIENGAIITSGGGFSLYTPMPNFQQSAVSTYLNNSGTLLPPSFSFNPQNRAIPDIALNGHNYQVSISTNSRNYDKCPCKIGSVDGTSCSSPAFAGFISLINNLLLNEGLGPVGPLNQILYQMAIDEPSAFTTISEGDNKCTESNCCLYGYETSDNVWNPVTGLGTPDFTQLQNYILQSKRTDPILPELEIQKTGTLELLNCSEYLSINNI